MSRPRQNQLPARQVAVSGHFKLVFLSLLGLTLFLWVGSAILSVLAAGHPQIAMVDDDFATAGKLVTGTVVGLVGGRAVK